MLAARMHDIHALVVSLGLYYSGMAYGWLPYMTVLPELVPAGQRGVAAGYQSLSAGIGGYSGNTIGFLIGSGVLSAGSAIWFLELIMLLSIPLGWWSLSGRPGFCQAERIPAKKRAPPLATADGRSRWTRFRVDVRRFFSALTSPAYRYYFIFGFVGACNPWPAFIFYWYEDTFAPRFIFFGWQLTNTTESAVAILSGITYLISMIAPLPGGYLGDKLGRRKIVLSLWASQLFQPVLFMLIKNFSFIILTTVFTGITGVRRYLVFAILRDCVSSTARS